MTITPQRSEFITTKFKLENYETKTFIIKISTIKEEDGSMIAILAAYIAINLADLAARGARIYAHRSGCTRSMGPYY